MTNRSPASSNPSGLVGVYWGRTRAPAGSAMRANEVEDDGEARRGRGGAWGGRNQRHPSSPEAAAPAPIPVNCCSTCSGERWVRFREVRGVEWCESLVLGRAPFIGSTVRPSGMGGRRWRHGYGELAAWLGMAIDGRSPGGALALQCGRRGGGMRSG